jgi:membrane protease YdiL (CAAX protease family)
LPVLFGKEVTSTIPFIAGLLSLLFHCFFRRDESFSKAGFILAEPSNYFEAIMIIFTVLGVILAVGWMLVGLKFHEEMQIIDWVKFAINIPIRAIILGIFATLTEEYFFRGVVQNELYKACSPIYAVLFASLIFGLWHLPFGIFYKLKGCEIMLYVLGTFLIGFIFGGLFYKSKSLLVAGLAHGTWNAIVYILYGLGNEVSGLLSNDNGAITHPEYGIIGILVLIVPAVLMILFRF